MKNAVQQGQWIRVVQYGYDGAGRLVSAEDADGVRTEFAYDERNRLVSQKRPCGLTFSYRYDKLGRCVETWGEFPGAKDPSLAPDLPLSLADGDSRAKGVHHAKLIFGDDGYSEVTTSITMHRYFSNKHGKLDKAVAAGAVYARKFDDNGFLVEFEDACHATTRWERDLQGRETKIVDALGNETRITRDFDGHIREIVEPGGAITRVERGASTLSWQDPIGAMFQVHFEARGLIDQTLAPNGDVVRYRYDEHGNMVERTSAQGAVSRATYDGWGRCTSTTDAAGATTRSVYSSAGRVLAVTSADGETVRYDHDAAGRVVAITDNLGRTTQGYGGLDRLCEVVAPNGERVSLRYDREGRLSTVTNARGEVNRFVRALDGMVLEEHTFDGRTLTFKYDRMGRLVAARNGAGQKVTIERDILGRMVKRTSDGVDESFEHDVRGDVIRAISGQIEVLFERNAVGWILKETQRVAGDEVVVELVYDAMGTLARRGTSRGHSLAWERHGTQDSVVLDGRDRIDVAYDAAGREVGRRLPQGGLISTAYDVSGRLASRQVVDTARAPQVGEGEPAWLGGTAGTVTVDQRYSFSAGLLAKRWDRALGLTQFEYDPLRRLLSVIPEKSRAELFRYGTGGELHDANATTRAYGPGGRPLRSAEADYQWDDAGRVVEAKAANGERTRYEWSGTGQLLAVVRPDGQRIEFAYDAFNRRMAKRSVRVERRVRRVESQVRFVWDSTTLVHEIKTRAVETGDPVVEERTFCFEEHRSAPWAQRDARIVGGERTESGWFHYLNDDSGAPERLVDGRGEVAGELRLGTWGDGEMVAGGVTATPFRFRGQYADEETGLSYNFHRYYDPATGRYLSADPIGLLGGPDVFAYANHCPTSSVDVEGLMYSIIKKGNHKVVDGENTGVTDRHGALDGSPDKFRPSCAESSALNQLAKKIQRENKGMNDQQVRAEMKSRFTNGGYTMETYEGDRADYEGGRRIVVNPCEKCAAMIKDQDIAGSVKAANKQDGPKRKPEPWNGKSTYKPAKKAWL
jgi:RHS repeat-associated protein